MKMEKKLSQTGNGIKKRIQFIIIWLKNFSSNSRAKNAWSKFKYAEKESWSPEGRRSEWLITKHWNDTLLKLFGFRERGNFHTQNCELWGRLSLIWNFLRVHNSMQRGWVFFLPLFSCNFDDQPSPVLHRFVIFRHTKWGYWSLRATKSVSCLFKGTIALGQSSWSLKSVCNLLL